MIVQGSLSDLQLLAVIVPTPASSHSEDGLKTLDIQLMAFKVNSYPQNKAALSGAALNSTGTIPLYKAEAPSLRSNSRKASRTPRGYFPSGAVQIRLAKTSPGRATNHHIVPAMPPAKRTGRDPTSSREVSGGIRVLTKCS